MTEKMAMSDADDFHGRLQRFCGLYWEEIATFCTCLLTEGRTAHCGLGNQN